MLRSTKGTSHPRAKLNENQVRYIRSCMTNATAAGTPERRAMRDFLCAVFGISDGTVWTITSGKNWSSVK